MIIGKIHPGSGIGDQLFSYIVTRVIALDKGYDFGFVGNEFFKGKDFMQLDWGIGVDLLYHVEPSSGALVIDNNDPQPRYHWNKEFIFNKPYYDPEVNFIEDGTIIDGTGAQDERYWGHRLDEIKEWLKVEPLNMGIVCAMNIRGGEYRGVSDLILPFEYWIKGLGIVNKDEEKKIQIHTDDIDYCKQMFGGAFEIYRDIAFNWKALRYAKTAIISNSAFAIIPRLLKHLEDPEAVTIAPRHWAGRNVGEWRRPQNYYKKFTYI